MLSIGMGVLTGGRGAGILILAMRSAVGIEEAERVTQAGMRGLWIGHVRATHGARIVHSKPRCETRCMEQVSAGQEHDLVQGDVWIEAVVLSWRGWLSALRLDSGRLL